MHNFYFDGVSSGDYNIHASGEAVYNAAERDVEVVSIPGRNGDLVIDNGKFRNIEVSYPCVIDKQFLSSASDIRTWLGKRSYGYYRLMDDYNPDYFRMARYKGGVEFAPMYQNKAAAEIDVVFDCKPQRFLASTDFFAEIGYATSFHNPTGFPALPIFALRIHPGAANFTVGNNVFHFDSDLIGIVYLDFETQNLYKAESKVCELGYTTTTSGDPIERVELSLEDAEKLVAFINSQLTGKTLKHLNRDTGVGTSYVCGKASIRSSDGQIMVTRSNSSTRYYLATPDKKLLVVGDATSAAGESYLWDVYDNPIEYQNCNDAVSGKDFKPIENETFVIADGTVISAIYMNPRWWTL